MEKQALSEAVINAIKAGKKISAIKLLREEQGIGLKQAKEMIDNYIDAHTEVKAAFEANQPTGFSVARLIQLLVVMLLVIVGYYYYKG